MGVTHSRFNRVFFGFMIRALKTQMSEHRSIILISVDLRLKVSEAYGLAPGVPMRRSLTTLLTTLAVVASLVFMSQFPAISSVSSVHPKTTEGERPPSTDTDGDKIPDVHEN